MIEFFSTYNFSQIIVFSLGMIIVAKGFWDLIDYFKKKYEEKFNKDFEKKIKENTLDDHYKISTERHEEMVEKYNSIEQKIDNLANNVDNRFQSLESRINALTLSDMHDIKQSIVKDYHYFKDTRGWIDDFSLETLELRYNDYKEEGGNSYISSLMSEIRNLPKRPPQN